MQVLQNASEVGGFDIIQNEANDITDLCFIGHLAGLDNANVSHLHGFDVLHDLNTDPNGNFRVIGNVSEIDVNLYASFLSNKFKKNESCPIEPFQVKMKVSNCRITYISLTVSNSIVP